MKNKLKCIHTQQEPEYLNTNRRTPTLSKNNTRDTRTRCSKSRRRARYGQGSSTFQESSVRQRYGNRLKKNGNRLRNNRVPSVKENDPIPKEKHCLEPLKDNKTKDNKAKLWTSVPIFRDNHISRQSDLGQGWNCQEWMQQSLQKLWYAGE